MVAHIWKVLLTLPAACWGCGGGSPTSHADAGAGDAGADGAVLEVAPPVAPAEPELPAQPAPPRLQSWECPEGWRPVVHETVTDEDGLPFSWCEPLPIPRLRLDDWVTPVVGDEHEGERPICDPSADGTFPVVGHADCQPLGDPCPAGTFPDIPPDVPGYRWYVLAGAHGGDGSEQAPFATIDEAVEAAMAGDVVVVGAGTYGPQVILDEDLTLWGRCVRDTVVDGTRSSGAVVVREGVAATIRNLRLTGDGPAVSSWGEVTLRGVWVRGATDYAVRLRAGQAVLDHVLVDSTAWTGVDQPDEFGSFDQGRLLLRGGGGAGLRVEQDTVSVEVTSSTFENNSYGGILLLGSAPGVGPTLDLEDVLVRATHHFGADGGFGLSLWGGGLETTGRRVVVDGSESFNVVMGDSGIDVDYLVSVRSRIATHPLEDSYGLLAMGSSVRLRHALFDDNEGIGVVASAGDLQAEDLVVRGTFEESSGGRQGWRGFGLFADQEAVAELRRALFDTNQTYGLVVLGPNFSAEDLWVRGTRSDSNGNRGMGLWAQGQAQGFSSHVTVRRARFEENRHAGIAVTAVGSLNLEDVAVVDTMAEEGAIGRPGIGLGLETANVTARRLLLERNRGYGLLTQLGTREITIEDLTVRDTLPAGDAAGVIWGAGVYLSGPSAIALSRVLLEDNRFAGIFVWGERAVAMASDVTIRPKAESEAGERPHYGIVVGAGGRATVERARIEDNLRAGLLVLQAGGVSSLVATDTQIAATRFDQNAADFIGLEANTSGGAVALEGASLTLSRAVVAGNAAHGVVADWGSALALEDVVIADTQPEQEAGRFGLGLRVAGGSSATVLRAQIERNRSFGIFADGAATLRLEDVLVADTQSAAYDGRFGRGLEVEGGGDIEVVHSALLGNRDVGVAAFGPGSRLALREVLVADTTDRACSDLAADDPNACFTERGYGISAVGEAIVTVDGLEIANGAALGLQLVGGATSTGRGLRVHDCPVAVDLQGPPEGYDLGASVEDLELWANGRSASDGGMSVPEPAPR